MSMIFDGFENATHAVAFAITVEAKYDLHWQLFSSPDEAQRHYPIPSVLVAPILHVDRPYDEGGEDELEIEELAKHFGVRFVGT